MNEKENVIKLNYPIKANGLQVHELRIRRAKVRDIEVLDSVQGQTAQAITLLSNLCSVSPEEIRELDASDFQKASELVADFLG